MLSVPAFEPRPESRGEILETPAHVALRDEGLVDVTNLAPIIECAPAPFRQFHDRRRKCPGHFISYGDAGLGVKSEVWD
jgi:hypothetical protein